MRKRDKLAAGAVLGTVAVGVFALGGSTRFFALMIAVLGIASGAIYTRSRREFVEVPPLLGLLIVASGAALFQLLPLPRAIVSALSPEKAKLVVLNAAALGESPPGWTSISFEPSSTWLALATLIGLIAVTSAAIRVGATRQGRAWLAQGLVVIATTTALIGICHQLAQATSLFGIYSPKEFRVPISFMAPLMNPNHFAMVLAAAVPIAIGLAYSNQAGRRLLWGGAAAICAATALLLESRTGTVSLVIGLAVIIGLLLRLGWSQTRSRAKNAGSRAAVIVIVFVAIGGGLIYFGEGAVEEITATQVDELTGERGKIAVWRSSTELLWEHKLVGVGRGAFEQAFTPRLHESRFRFARVENEYLQFAIDYGIPIAALLLALFLLALKTAARRATRSSIEAGLFTSVVVVGVHSVADFGVELPGPALFALVAFAAISRVEVSKARPRRGLRPSVARGATVIAGLALVAAAASPLGVGPREDSETLRRITEPTERTARAIENWRRHPSDYIAAGQAADALRLTSDSRAFRVAARALSINPTHWQLHATVARMLVQAGRPSQALGEYRLATEHAPKLDGLVAEIAEQFPQSEDALRAMPIGERRTIPTALALWRSKSFSIGFSYLRRQTSLYPENARAFEELTRFSFNRREWTVAAAAGSRALELGRRSSLSLAARALIRAGSPADAVRLLVEARANPTAPRARTHHSIAELRALAQAHVATDQPKLAVKALESALDLKGRQDPKAAPIFLYLAGIQEKMGLLHQAEENRKSAERLQRTDLNDSPPGSN